MALKFLNKKGWHTGSLRNIENVWKAEQKQDAEQRKLEELRKQIQEEREKSEFRLLQEQAGLVPRQERLDFLYDSGLACGKGSSDGFKALEALPKPDTETAPSSSKKEAATAPGALFEEKPQSANDAWRKLHSDPLLLIRQREQEAIAHIKNNPVQMANIRKSLVKKEKSKEKSEKKKKKKKRSHKESRREKYISSKVQSSDDEDASEGEERKRRSRHHSSKKLEHYSSDGRSDSETEEKRKRSYGKSKGQSLEDDDVSDREERKRRGYNHSRKMLDSSNDRPYSETKENRKRSYDNYSSTKRQSLEKDDVNQCEEKEKRNRYHGDKKLEQYSSSSRSGAETEDKIRGSYEKYSSSMRPISEDDDVNEREEREKRNHHHNRSYDKYSSSKDQTLEKDAANNGEGREKRSRYHDDKKFEQYSSNKRSASETDEKQERIHEKSKYERDSIQMVEAPKEHLEKSHQKQRRTVTKLSEEEKAARLREMEIDAVLHEEQRWKRLKIASENDAQEASRASSLGGQNFLNAAQKSVYGAEKGGSATIEESVRRRKYYSQGRSESNEGNAFRR